jgi:hypothetical protein
MLVSYLILWALVGVLTLAVFGLYHHFGEMYLSSREGRSAQGPSRDELLPGARVTDVDGQDVAIGAQGAAQVLLFASTTCRLCKELTEDLAALASEGAVDVIVICSGEGSRVRQWAGQLDPCRVVLDSGLRLATRYRIGITPFFVSVASDGVVRERGIVNDALGLEYARDVALGLHGTSTDDMEAEDERLAQVGNARAQ